MEPFYKPNDKDYQHNYFQYYEKVAGHYHLPVWSYRDAVLSPVSEVKQANFSDQLNFKAAYKFTGNHPTWHVHLFMADLFSALTAREFQQCASNPTEGRKLSIKSSNRTATDLPLPLSKKDFSIVCNAKFAPIISVSYENIVTNKPNTGIL